MKQRIHFYMPTISFGDYIHLYARCLIFVYRKKLKNFDGIYFFFFSCLLIYMLPLNFHFLVYAIPCNFWMEFVDMRSLIHVHKHVIHIFFFCLLQIICHCCLHDFSSVFLFRYSPIILSFYLICAIYSLSTRCSFNSKYANGEDYFPLSFPCVVSIELCKNKGFFACIYRMKRQQQQIVVKQK